MHTRAIMNINMLTTSTPEIVSSQALLVNQPPTPCLPASQSSRPPEN